MPSKTHSGDYLIVGAGAVGMAFADTLLSDSDATMVIVDRHQQPGGHWNVAYPFVTLHQPSAYYGVPSRELSTGQLETQGLNRGLAHLASGAQVSAYFDSVMRERLLPSGRVQYFPMSDYLGEGRFVSTLSGETHTVEATKHVDATYLNTTVPSTHTPSFSIAEGVRFVPVNGLANLAEAPKDYVIVGGGKTGIDAVLFLLENGVDPASIRWIMPRDAWLLDRRNTQSTVEFFADTMGAQASQFEAIAQASSIDDLFDRLEAAGVLLRIDPSVTPKMFHGATISQLELQELRRVKDGIVRMGRVSHIGHNEIVLDEGTVPTSPDTLHVDCSASAISNLETKPIFQGDLITPQTVRSYQPVFSASLIAHVEATRESEDEKNRLCGVVALPNHDTDWIRMMIPFMMNQYQWSRDPELRVWLEQNRLDGFSGMVRSVDKTDEAKQAILKRMRDASMPAMAKLQQFAAQLETAV